MDPESARAAVVSAAASAAVDLNAAAVDSNAAVVDSNAAVAAASRRPGAVVTPAVRPTGHSTPTSGPIPHGTTTQDSTAHLHADAVALLAGWSAPDPSQHSVGEAFQAFLAARPDACARSCAPGHLTASAVVFSADLSQVALVLHGIVGAWLNPGGHLEASDSSLLDAARREVREELGLEVDLLPAPITLDCHPITCRGYTRPTRHLDVRFAGRAAAGAEVVCSDESRDVRWWPVDALPDVFPEVRLLIDAGRRRLSAGT